MSTITENLNQSQLRNYQSNSSALAGASRMSLADRYNLFIERLKFSHFGVMTMAILIGSCLGSITAMAVFYSGAPIWVFAIGLFATLANLVTCISQSPTKWMVNVFVFSVLVNLILIAIFPII